MSCPECNDNQSFVASRQITPNNTVEIYTCPNPDCRVSTFRVVMEK